MKSLQITFKQNHIFLSLYKNREMDKCFSKAKRTYAFWKAERTFKLPAVHGYEAENFISC